MDEKQQKENLRNIKTENKDLNVKSNTIQGII